MDGLARRLRAEVAAARPQVVVVEVPDEPRPRVVEHPLDDAGRAVAVPRERLEHRALTLVGHELRLQRVVFYAVRFAVARAQGFRENV